ncbi:unnamed protein product, partial [Musa banksii]
MNSVDLLANRSSLSWKACFQRHEPACGMRDTSKALHSWIAKRHRQHGGAHFTDAKHLHKT